MAQEQGEGETKGQVIIKGGTWCPYQKEEKQPDSLVGTYSIMDGTKVTQYYLHDTGVINVLTFNMDATKSRDSLPGIEIGTAGRIEEQELPEGGKQFTLKYTPKIQIAGKIDHRKIKL